MPDQHRLTFQFISEPTDVNFGGHVHGGIVMKWIDQTAYTCATTWAETYCVTVYVGGIRFYKPIHIGDVIRIDSSVIHTGGTSVHIAVDVHARKPTQSHFEKKTHCVIVFVSIDSKGKPQPVKKWTPETPNDQRMEEYALKLKSLRQEIDQEMEPFLRDE